MKISSGGYVNVVFIFLQLISLTQVLAQTLTYTCNYGPCSGIQIPCPKQCQGGVTDIEPSKFCIVDCESPKCEAACISLGPDCTGTGSGCHDPRFIGKDGVVFYFHGKSNQHFSLVSDTNLQINARFIGHRPAGRPRDFTWIQSLGILFGSHTVSVEATKAAVWDDQIDHLRFSVDGQQVFLPEGFLNKWTSQVKNNQVLKLERSANKNSVIISIPNIVEIGVRVVPVTEEENRVHNYQIPDDDCFAHLEVQFRFFNLSSKVDGVIGRTYRPNYETPAKLGDPMPVFGGEDEYRTTSLFSADCKDCLFNPNTNLINNPLPIDYGTLKCTSGLSPGVGIVCKK
ncbi:OLC1v1029250C1 [Oldenlandia corymbosa var. corymbosa]|uniref:OLC1v1029250C1 n=1 Tax=Oldenlandia corymbosa var. corymbosa TaxID=529605 RepID=A0AAV1CGT2_OLDCO|nr:OLC1v1029250C1 [Oldenlandia corymbosa var. corymbosa]